MKLATQIIEDIRNGQADALLTGIYQYKLPWKNIIKYQST